MQTWIVISALVLVAASGCEADERRSDGADAAAVTVAYNPCEGQPDDSRPPGCDGFYDCTRDKCQSGICVESPTPGRSCGRNNSGTCDQSGQCISCDFKCEQKLNDCRQRCYGGGQERCLCVCERTYGYCLVRCGPPAPEPIICPA